MIRRYISSLFIILAGVGTAFLSNFILAKTLSSYDYGVFSFIYSLSLLLSIFSLFGFQNSLVRFISGYQGQPNIIKNLVAFAKQFTFVIAIVSTLICLGILYLSGLSEKYSSFSLLSMIALVPLMVLLRLHSSVLRGYECVSLSVMVETTLREGIFCLALIGSYIMGNAIDNSTEALTVFFLTLMTAILISHILLRRYKPPVGEITESASYNKLDWIKISFPMMVIVFCQRLVRRSDVIILGLMVNPVLVGAYSLVAQFADVSSMGQKGIFALFSAPAARFYREGNKESLKKAYVKMQIYSAITTGGACLVIAWAAPYVLSYFGKDYEQGYHALLILLAGQFINVCFGPVGILLIMTAYEKISMKYTALSAIANVIACPIAIYFYGIMGAACVTATFLIIRALFSYIFARKEGLL